ncbi:MAG: response regulator [Deltaproteobacteria bacterium]|nr:response regulator [Deltaproteobacteria bacterium]MBW2018133.1 response regulator [Deltaproteobacteria bacterium]MBW2129984.1 response regulator [Deltaproteobacteria bacterium]MBW2304625.1 response regulator [Deltaproteobacteria bacterium]
MRNKYFVVLVDDEEKVHNTIRLYLERNEVLKELKSFYDPIELLEYLKTTGDPIDLILLDIHFKDSGLSGLEAIPFIREDYPYLPIILLTGMDTEAIQEAERFSHTYFIPKPVTGAHLIKMIDFYVGKSEHEVEEIRELEKRIQEHLEYQTLLEEEMKRVEEDRDEIRERLNRSNEMRAFENVKDIIGNLLKNSEMTDYAVEDLEDIYFKRNELFSGLVEGLVQFDRDTMSTPGSNIHKYQGVEDVYSVRLSRKARLYVYKGPQTVRKRILRVDVRHDSATIEAWLKSHYRHYADPKPGRGGPK